MTAPFKPMLAKPMSAKGLVARWSDWAIEEKYDGHRLIIEVTATKSKLALPSNVCAWSRPRGEHDEMAVRDLPQHIVNDLAKLPAGVYDGELLVDVEGATGTDVTRTDLESKRYVMLFDVLQLVGKSVVGEPYTERHMMLYGAAATAHLLASRVVRVAPMTLVDSEDDVKRFVEAVWKRGGEGAILKRRLGSYEPGIRSRNCVKVKRVTHAVLTVAGFEKSKGTVRFPGHPFAIVKLRDDEGNETTVKAKNDFELARLTVSWNKPNRPPRALPLDEKEAATHPWVGRKLMIEFPKRTRTGGYQGPVLWDRWAEDGE